MSLARHRRRCALVTVLFVGVGPAAAPSAQGQTPVAVGAAPHDRSATRGPVVALGYGAAFAGAGVQVAYAFPLPPEARLDPRLGLGLFDDADMLLGASAGLTLGFGRQHRGLLDLGYGPVLTQRLDLHGTRLDARALYGVQLSAGYGLCLPGGFSLQVLAGTVRPLDRRAESAERLFSRATVTLGVGWKAW
jgi:hypothetical protein